MMGKGTELEFPEGRGGGKGEPTVPPREYNIQKSSTFLNKLKFSIIYI